MIRALKQLEGEREVGVSKHTIYAWKRSTLRVLILQLLRLLDRTELSGRNAFASIRLTSEPLNKLVWIWV